MKLLWLTHMLPFPPSGGSLLRTYHLLLEASRFAEVDVVAFVQRPLMPTDADVQRAVRELGKFCTIRAVHDIPAQTRMQKGALALRCLLSGGSYTCAWSRSDPYRASVREALADDPDFVVLDTIGLAGNLPDALRVPLVLNHHNEEVSMLVRRAERARSRLVAAYLRREAATLRDECRRLFPSVAVHLVTSELDAERLAVIDGAARARVVPNGVDTDAYLPAPSAPGATRDPFDLLFIGGGTWYPNRDAMEWLVAGIWPLVRERIPGARLVLVGRDPVPSAVAEAQRDSRVIAPGFVDDIRPYAARASVFVCPIRDGGGTRLKLLHAMSLGVPIVSTALGAEGIDMRNEDHFLRAETSEQFADAIARLLADPVLRTRLAVAGRQLAVQTYDWRRVGEALKSALTAASRDSQKGEQFLRFGNSDRRERHSTDSGTLF